jgi:hypothetical protein
MSAAMEATALENLQRHYLQFFHLVPQQAEAFSVPSTLQEIIQQLCTSVL